MTSTPQTPDRPEDTLASPSSKILLGQKRILGLVAGGTNLTGVLQEFCQILESAMPDGRCCIMLLDPSRQVLEVGSAHSLPASFRGLLDGISVGLAPGSCSAAAHRNQIVISENIADDPVWEGLHDAARENDLGACWSAPIRSVRWAEKPEQEDELRVLGTVALYYPSPRRPSAEDVDALDMASSMAALAMTSTRAHAKVDEQGLYDGPTGLPNRKLFVQQVQQQLSELNPKEHKLGILLLDIDKFKEVNESFGYAVGDFLLRAVAERLTQSRKADDLIARFGNDEFILMILDASGKADYRQIATNLLTAVSEPHDFGGQELTVTASLGASVYPWDGEDAQTLIRNSENALQKAKDQGGGRHRLYAPTMGANTFEKLQLKMALGYALENRELDLHYQPKVSSSTGEIVGVEALARWEHPSLGRIGPTKFIPLAEETGLILPIGTWALKRACEQVKKWRNAGHSSLTVAVNISAPQFRERGFVDTVDSALKSVGLEPSALELEITESIAMTEVDKTMARLKELEDLGLRISIDDFGTGYSSLAYLERFPIHTLKIDRSFIHNMQSQKENKAIVKAVVAMAHYLGLDVVAEGVETAEQADFLVRENCEVLQGFFFARPLPSQDCGRLLEDGLGNQEFFDRPRKQVRTE
jgi:diguanylate cyclase (GGDEF)-like protein